MSPTPAHDDGHAYLLTYFLSEEVDGEDVRFAVSDGPTPERFTPVSDGAPILRSTGGDGGARDPFIVRTGSGFVVVATDLRVGTDGDWPSTTRHGSRDIVVWHSPDLVTWSEPRYRTVAPADAGNAWAPKAFRHPERDTWLVFFASALYGGRKDRSTGSYQRILAVPTDDFDAFGPPETVVDVGHDVIDATFLEHEGSWYRFSVNAQAPGGIPDTGHHIFEEVGSGLTAADFRPLAVDIGQDVMLRGEGPAVAADPAGDRWYLLADEFGHRGYQLFETEDLTAGRWDHLAHARLPDGARHGSLLLITAQEADALRALPAAQDDGRD